MMQRYFNTVPKNIVGKWTLLKLCLKIKNEQQVDHYLKWLPHNEEPDILKQY